MSQPQAHIAGIGISSGTQQDISNLAVSAGAKALLDAGITYAKVRLSIACSLEEARLSIPQECFKAFGRQKAPICAVDSQSALFTAVQCVRSGQIDCAMVVGLDLERASKYNKSIKIAAIAVVFVNDRFLTSHAYLKDSAVCVRACHLAATGKDPRGPVFSALRQAKLGAEDVQLVEVQGTVSSPSQGQDLLSNGDFKEDVISAPELAPLVGFGTTSLTGLCEIVWRLRGWVHESKPNLRNSLQYTSTANGSIAVAIFSRSDGAPAPAYEDVRNLRDGRERLGHNPAEEVKEIGWRMEGVKSREGDRIPFAGDQELRLASQNGDRAALARL